MAEITEIIPEQGFEIVLRQLGAIIKLELDNQKSLQSLSEPINVYNSRITPFAMAEELMINVLLDSSNYSNLTQVSADGETVFNIDIHCSGKANKDNNGCLDSQLRLNKFTGMIRYILSSPKYQTLGLGGELIGNRRVTGFDNFDNPNKQDSSFVRISRISYTVNIHECQEAFEGVELAGTDTDVKLDLTELGYKYQYNKI